MGWLRNNSLLGTYGFMVRVPSFANIMNCDDLSLSDGPLIGSKTVYGFILYIKVQLKYDLFFYFLSHWRKKISLNLNLAMNKSHHLLLFHSKGSYIMFELQLKVDLNLSFPWHIEINKTVWIGSITRTSPRRGFKLQPVN